MNVKITFLHQKQSVEVDLDTETLPSIDDLILLEKGNEQFKVKVLKRVFDFRSPSQKVELHCEHISEHISIFDVDFDDDTEGVIDNIMEQ